MPKVSVIVPVYNIEKYLSKCLDSLLAQTLADIEIICVNDCSTDGSLRLLQEYAGKDNRIKIIDFEKNQGAAVARNGLTDGYKIDIFSDVINFIEEELDVTYGEDEDNTLQIKSFTVRPLKRVLMLLKET